jgi:hypothetical protein
MTRTVELSLNFVVTEEAALMRTHTGDGRETAAVVDDETDGRRR